MVSTVNTIVIHVSTEYVALNTNEQTQIINLNDCIGRHSSL